MFDRVLVCLDGSQNSEIVVPWARTLFHNQQISLVRVVEESKEAEKSSLEGSRAMDKARLYLERVASKILPSPAIFVRTGNAETEILAVARTVDANIIALTSHGGDPLTRRAVGGTTERLLHATERPLLVVPAWVGPPENAPIRRILVPLDGTPDSEMIMPLAEWLAIRNEAGLIALHVVHPDQADDETLLDKSENLGRVMERMERPELLQDSIIRMGPIEETIQDVMSSYDIDTCVMSSHGYGSVMRALEGSVASETIRQSSVPLVVAKRKGATANHRPRPPEVNNEASKTVM